MKRGLFWTAIAFGIFGTIALLVHPIDWNLTLHRIPHPLEARLSVSPGTANAQTAEQGLESLRSQSKAFVSIAKMVLPSVVSITSERTVHTTGFNGGGGMQFFGDPFLQRFFQAPDRAVPQTGAGSGVVVSKDGYILTNNHVVADAERIKVTMEDGRDFDGELVGRDPKSDIAVVRIKAKGEDLVPIQLGDSDQLEVGEWVMAVGNPFQLSSTVTAGIVSAVGRSNVGLTDYEDFIQTDAAINPGNSGGALVNLDGQLVGVNTAIATRTGGNMGVGFAIPVNMARKVMDDLITHGKVTRGWLGIQIQNLSDDSADALGLDRPRGALVNSVDPKGPAAAAGIERQDVITAIDGKDVKNTEDLRLRITDIAPGTRVELTILRDKREMTVPVKLGELETHDEETGPGYQGGEQSKSDQISDLGLSVDELDSSTRQELDLPSSVDGVVVSDVDPAKPAGRVGLQRGDVILKVGSKEVTSVRTFRDALKSVAPGKATLFLVRRDGNEIFLGLRMPEE